MCNAHNHSPGCTCGWGGDSFVKEDNKTFNTLFGTLVRKPKKNKVNKDMSSSKPIFNQLFDINTKDTD